MPFFECDPMQVGRLSLIPFVLDDADKWRRVRPNKTGVGGPISVLTFVAVLKAPSWDRWSV